ncbi:hypothetical protein Hanom_Chr14g01313741 [Helianthus anomalus]
MSVVCEPHLQASTREDVAQMSAVCKEKRVCFFSSKTTSTTQHTQALSLLSLYLSTNSLSLSTTTTAPLLPPPPHTSTITPPPSHHRLSFSTVSLSHRTHTLSLPPPPTHHLRHHIALSQVSLYLSHRSLSLSLRLKEHSRAPSSVKKLLMLNDDESTPKDKGYRWGPKCGNYWINQVSMS